jgi:hypothetical protein
MLNRLEFTMGDLITGEMVGDTGLQHPAESNGKTPVSARGGAKSGALTPKSAPATPVTLPAHVRPTATAAGSIPPIADLPPDVLDLARRLAALPEAVRAALVAALKRD